MLKILCESPSKLPLATRVALVHPKSAALRDRYLGDGGNFLSYPALTWLSPLNRATDFFPLVRIPRDGDQRSELMSITIPK
jgi:hypothetical protein